MFWCGLNPNAVSICCKACGDSWFFVRTRSACTGLPGMNRGMKKFSVNAAHRVSTKKPSRRTTNLIRHLLLASSCFLRGPRVASVSRSGAGRVQVQQHLLVVRHVERGWLCVRILLGRPTTDLRGVVLEPVDRLGHRDHRNVLQHHLLDLLDDGDLAGRSGRRVLVEELV